MNPQSGNFCSGYEGERESRVSTQDWTRYVQHFPDLEQEVSEGKRTKQVDPIITLALCTEAISGQWGGEPKQPDSVTELRSEVSESSETGVARVCEAESQRENAMQVKSSRNQPRNSLELLAENQSSHVWGETLQDWKQDSSWGKNNYWELSAKNNLQSLHKARHRLSSHQAEWRDFVVSTGYSGETQKGSCFTRGTN